LKHLISGKLKTFTAFLASYCLLFFFISTIAYLELVYRIWNFKTLGVDYIFPVLFAVPAGTVLFLLSGLFSKRANNAAAISFTVLLVFVYSMQLIYYCVFHTPLSAYSLTGAGDVLQFGDIIAGTVMKNFIALVLLFVPLILLFAISRKLSFSRIKTVPICITLLFCITSYAIPVICVNLTDKNSISQYTLYYKTFSPELSVSRLGLMTTMRLDVERLVFGFERNETAVPSFAESTADGSDTDGTVKTDDSVSAPEPDIMETGPSYAYNVMDIDFQSLIVNEKDKNLLAMHEYFSSAKPTRTNDYTGIFEGVD
jgi:hypothetical protein